jgi:hypothetical protein
LLITPPFWTLGLEKASTEGGPRAAWLELSDP